jgi:hypothetical protein
VYLKHLPFFTEREREREGDREERKGEIYKEIWLLCILSEANVFRGIHNLSLSNHAFH